MKILIQVGDFSEERTRKFSVDVVGQFAAWNAPADIVLKPSVLMTQSGTTLTLRSGSDDDQKLAAPPSSASTATYFTMEGVGLSMTNLNCEEFARCHVQAIDFSSVPAGTVHVTVVRGSVFGDSDGMLTDTFHDTDPYCVLEVAGESQTTAVVKNTLEPVWVDAEHPLDVHYRFKYHFCARTTDKLTIKVFDEEMGMGMHTLIDDKFIGECSVELAGLLPNAGETSFEGVLEARLKLPDSSVETGSIRILLAFEPEPVTLAVGETDILPTPLLPTETPNKGRGSAQNE